MASCAICCFDNVQINLSRFFGISVAKQTGQTGQTGRTVFGNACITDASMSLQLML